MPQLLRFSSDTAGGAALPCSKEAAKTQRGTQSERDLGLHVRELLLHELVGGERPSELLAIEHVLARPVPAELGGADRAPGDTCRAPR